MNKEAATQLEIIPSRKNEEIKIGIIIIKLEIERIKTIWKTEKSPTSVLIKIICAIKKTSLKISQ